MKFLAIVALISFTTSSFASDLCRKSIETQLKVSKSAYTLLADQGHILSPDQDVPYRMGEMFNPTSEVAIVFGASRSNGYYKEYIGVVASLKTCKILTTIEIGDDLD